MTDEEIVRRVAVEVMEWEIKIRDFPRPGHCWIYDKDGNEIMALFMFNPLTNSNHWMRVVERMRELGWAVRLYSSGTDFRCILTDFTQGKDYSVCASDWGHAVCLASIRAIEGVNNEKVVEEG